MITKFNLFENINSRSLINKVLIIKNKYDYDYSFVFLKYLVSVYSNDDFSLNHNQGLNVYSGVMTNIKKYLWTITDEDDYEFLSIREFYEQYKDYCEKIYIKSLDEKWSYIKDLLNEYVSELKKLREIKRFNI